MVSRFGAVTNKEISRIIKQTSCSQNTRRRWRNSVWKLWWECATRSSKSWRYFRPKKIIFLHPFSDLAFRLLRLEQQQKRFLKFHFEFAYFFSLLLIWNWHNKYVLTLPQFSWKPYLFSDQNDAKTLPLYGLYRGVPPPPLGRKTRRPFGHKRAKIVIVDSSKSVKNHHFCAQSSHSFNIFERNVLLKTACTILVILWMRNKCKRIGGSLQTRFISSMRAHVITRYGKRTGRPWQWPNHFCFVKMLKKQIAHCNITHWRTPIVPKTGLNYFIES